MAHFGSTNDALELSIMRFFVSSGTSLTRSQCEDYAQLHFGLPVVPLPTQGSRSFTLAVGPNQDRIVQFRTGDSVFDMEIMSLGHQIHPLLVPKVSFIGPVGGTAEKPLLVYIMKRMSGTPYGECKEMIMRSDEKILQMIGGLARFFASSWQQGRYSPIYNKLDILRELIARLRRIYIRMPDRLETAVYEQGDGIEPLTDASYPYVLTHNNLVEKNILVDPLTGRITGIIGWANATISPFGLDLFALDNCIGWMAPREWKYLPNKQEMLYAFWSKFGDETGGWEDAEMDGMALARVVGVFFRFADQQDRRKDVRDIRYVDDLVLGL